MLTMSKQVSDKKTNSEHYKKESSKIINEMRNCKKKVLI